MNELYGEKKPTFKGRMKRWIFVAMAVCAVGWGLTFLFPPATARLALVVAQDHEVEMVLTLIKGCRLDKVYLRGNDKVPKEGKLFTLVINDHKFDIADFEKQPEINANVEAGYKNRHAAIDWNLMKGDTTLKVYYIDVHKDIKRDDLDLVFEVVGDPEIVKDWNKFVKLYSRSSSAAK